MTGFSKNSHIFNTRIFNLEAIIIINNLNNKNHEIKAKQLEPGKFKRIYKNNYE